MIRLAGYLTRVSVLGGKVALMFAALALVSQVPAASRLIGASAAYAANGDIITAIDVEGNQRIERETVITYMTTRDGDA